MFQLFGLSFISKLFTAGAHSSTTYSAYNFNLGWIFSELYKQHANITGPLMIPIGSDHLKTMLIIFLLVFSLILIKAIFLSSNPLRFENLITSSSLGVASFLSLYPGIHTNYWVLLLCPLFFMTNNPTGKKLFIYVGIMSTINILFFYAIFKKNIYFSFGFGGSISIILSIINLIISFTFFYFFIIQKNKRMSLSIANYSK